MTNPRVRAQVAVSRRERHEERGKQVTAARPATARDRCLSTTQRYGATRLTTLDVSENP